MKVLGVVLELNPFHNGHEYFLKEAQKKVQPELTIAIVSGNFTMRGDAMVIDKWTKAQILLDYNVDIVLELPFLATVNSADFFTYNSINTLNDMQITDLAFGVELNDLPKLKEIITLLNSKTYNDLIKHFLSKGHSYSTSSYKAIQELTKDEVIIQNCTLPNNTLGIGYLQAIEKINPNINPTLIKRIKANYYDESIIDDKINSATALRKLLENYEDISSYTPNISYNYFNPKTINHNLLLLLRYVFTINKDFSNVFGVSEGIENRIESFLNKVETYDDLIENVKTKRYPPNRIKRLLLHLILGIDKAYENKYHHYLRILAMNKKGEKYLNTLPKDTKKSIITTFKSQNHYLVDIELKASKLYSLLVNKPNLYLQEFNVPYIGGK
ncbi:MAG TPA: nucleotidyltransferase family protein [Acholeplasmataceae bacterium]|nr:nucleotidyltransferase family protein [Acholeplasmataceae bacterium]